MDEIDWYLSEDLGEKGDITSDALFTGEKARAAIRAKQECILAGLEEAKTVFERTGATVKPLAHDGDFVRETTVVLEVTGTARSILKGERLALNFMGRMSGIATITKELVDRCRAINPKVTIAATRKTTPGFRKYEKKAVILGGGEPHRMGLYDAILIKDNHIRCVGSIQETIRRAKHKAKGTPIEVEVENEGEALIAAQHQVEVIMLDNFDPASGRRVSEKIRRIHPHVLIEVSGGVTPENIKEYAPFADRISLGYVTHSVRSKDFSLEIVSCEEMF